MLKTLSSYSLAVVLIWTILGCESSSNKSVELPKDAATAASNVPLRLWIVGQVSDPSLVERAWLTGSDQKLEIRTLAVDEYLSEKECNCDVTIFPSRLLGEMIDRKWLTKLPGKLTEADENTPQVPAAWARQVAYGSHVWAVSLGGSIPLTIVSGSAVESGSTAVDWDSLLKSLAIESPKSLTQEIDPADVNRPALVDRFLMIAGGLTQRSADYGLLFELQNMKPRLNAPEFVGAAEILLRLSQQPSQQANALQSMTGDSSQAWMWINAQTKPAITIVSPALLNAAASRESGCKSIRMPANGAGWNTGSGLIASLSASCRQSARATEFLRWLRQSETRHTLSPLIVGIESAIPVSGNESSAWQATSMANELAANASIPSELRLPRAEEYRRALADSLIAILSGEKPIADALAEATAAWQTITEARGRVLQRSDYEMSLGLRRD
jgi:hypothetical protein